MKNNSHLIWWLAIILLILNFVDLSLTQYNVGHAELEKTLIVRVFFNLSSEWGIYTLMWIKWSVILVGTYLIAIKDLKGTVKKRDVLILYGGLILLHLYGIFSNWVYMVAY